MLQVSVVITTYGDEATYSYVCDYPHTWNIY